MPDGEAYPLFVEPSDPNIKIWRYMDFTKYVSLLTTRALYFARADQFDDPFEGAKSRANTELRPLAYGKDYENMSKAKAFEAVSQHGEWVRQWTFINCWHMNEYESAAMWRLYSKTNEAIAIQSTYARLRECLPDRIHLSEVRYRDYGRDWIPEGNVYAPFLHKQKSFEHERELRAIFAELGAPASSANPEAGRLVEVDADALLEGVYVAPATPHWFEKVVEDVTRKYGVNKPVCHSSLDEGPVF